MFDYRTRLLALKRVNRFTGKSKAENHFNQKIIVTQGGMPECGHILVYFHHVGLFDQSFHNRCEGYDAATGEGLNQNFRPCFHQPLADMRNKPGFATRVS